MVSRGAFLISALLQLCQSLLSMKVLSFFFFFMGLNMPLTPYLTGDLSSLKQSTVSSCWSWSSTMAPISPSLVHILLWLPDNARPSPGRWHVCNVTFCHIMSWWKKPCRVHHNDRGGNENRTGNGCDTDLRLEGGGRVITQIVLFTNYADGCLCPRRGGARTHTQLSHLWHIC